MNKGRFGRACRTVLLTGLHYIPSIILYTLVFLLTAGILISLGRKLLTHDSTLGMVKIGYSIEEKSARNEFALNIVTGMDSFRESAELIEYPSREEGVDALNRGEIACLIFVPEGFIDELFGGPENANGMEVLFRDTKTMEGHLINDLLQSGANILGTAQGAYFALHFTDISLEIPEDTAYAIENSLDTRNLTYVLTRTDHFNYENFEVLSEFSIRQKLIASCLILIMFLSVFVVAYIYKFQNPVMQLRLNSIGFSRAGSFTAEALSVAVYIYGIYIITLTALIIAGEDLSMKAFLSGIPVVLISSFVITVFIYIFKNPVTAGLSTLIFTLIMMYLAGGLIPTEFLPVFLQKASVYNPFTYLIRFMLNVLWR